MVVVLTGGDEGTPGIGTPDRPKARPFTAQEREISGLVTHSPSGEGLPREKTDVQAFRRPFVRSVTCKDETCDIVYGVGLPGRGRILLDQRAILERIFGRTEIQKVTLTVTRDSAAAGVPPKAGEETPQGAPMLRTVCDRSRRRSVDWSSAKGAQILANVCEVDAFDQGEIHRQEPIAPDDETAGQSQDLPRPTPGG